MRLTWLLVASLGLILVPRESSPQTPGGQAAAPSPAERAAQLEAKVDATERSSGPNHPDVAAALNELAVFHFGQGDYAAAEPLLRRALTIRETSLGSESPLTAQSINNLAQVLQERGNYVDAEPLLERALAIQEKLRGPDHPDVAGALNNLAGLYRLEGNYRRAEPLYVRALAIREQTVGPDHPSVAIALNNLGLMYQQQGALAKARPLLERSLAIREKALGDDHPDVGRALNNLAVLSQEEGDLAAAEALYTRAIGIYEKAYGRLHPLVGQALNNLAVVYLLKGQLDKAGPMYEEAISIRRTVLGPTHPDMTRALTSEAIYFDVAGRPADAVKRQSESTEVSEHNLNLILASGSEVQKTRYMSTFGEETDITVSLHRVSEPGSAAAGRLALTTLLRRKGRVLDAMSGSLQTLRSRMSDADRAALDRLSATKGELATLVLRGPGRLDPAQFTAEVTRLEEVSQQIERDVSARSAAYRAQAQDVTIDTVQAALPQDAALIEIAIYRPFNNREAQRDRRFGKPRYVAYVLRSRGEPSSVELGEADSIDRQIATLRQALRDPKSSAYQPAARALYATVVAPVVPLLGGAVRLIVSPDGALNLVPFAALQKPDGRFLLESYDVSYVTSGRDLLRWRDRAPQSGRPLIVANPLFDTDTTRGESTSAPANRSVDLSRARFTPLKGTAMEAEALRHLVTDADVRTGSAATESSVKTAQGPKILHLATHGFFLGAEEHGPAQGDGRLLVQDAGASGAPRDIENPLLRSGLAFAGANQRNGGHGDDGILTALEASSLDLWGTRLTVLSACETGLGETKPGDGVYGLRRALVMAGSETQVMSLWQVSDDATRELMTMFYRGLKSGAARSAALRNTQIRMLRSAKRSHPYYWASFILSGADGPIVFQ